MASIAGDQEHPPPAPTEEVHRAGPSYLPALVPPGVTVVVVGVVASPLMLATGTLIFLLATVRWIRQVREEMAELPPQH